MPRDIDDMYDEANAEIERQARETLGLADMDIPQDPPKTWVTRSPHEPRVTKIEMTGPTFELYARVGYTYSKSAGWDHKDSTVSVKISGILAGTMDHAEDAIEDNLKTLSELAQQAASQEITRRNLHRADGPTSEIVVGDAQGVSGE